MMDPNRSAEPRGMTIPDLIWLSVGVAVAASLGWYHVQVATRTAAGGLMPGWFLSVDFAVETVMKGCLALAPVVIARRARYGGPIKAVEFALLAEGVGHLLVRLEQHPWLGVTYSEPSSPGSLLVDEKLSEIWQAGTLAVSLLTMFAAMLRRHRPPAWVVGVLLVIAYDGLSTSGTSYVRGWMSGQFPFERFSLGVGQALYLVFFQGPFQVIWFLPMGAALVEAMGREGARWTWVGWAAFALPVALAVTAYVRNFVKIYHGPKSGSSDGQYAYIAMLLGSLGLAMLLAWALAPAWGRFFATRGPGGEAVGGGSTAGVSG